MQSSAVRVQELNPAKLRRVKPSEKVAIVSHLGTRRDYIQAALSAAEALCGDYGVCVNAIPSWNNVGVPPSGCKGTL